MSYTVTFDIKDDKSNVLGCDALLDEFTTAEFGTGTLTDVEAADNSLTLEVSVAGSEDSYSAGTTSGGSYAWMEQQIEALDNVSISKVKFRSVAADLYTLSFRDWDNNELASSSGTASAGGDWIEFVLSSPVSITNGTQYKIRFIPTSSQKIYYSSSKYSGTLWKSLNYYGPWGNQGTGSVALVVSGEYAAPGNRVSTATDVGSYAATGPDLKIKWAETLPSGTSITIETGTSDSDATPPATWYEQTNGASITNLPADLTGKYLWYKASLATTDDSKTPELEWVCIYDADDDPYAAVRIDFNDEIKDVDSSGTVDFTGVEVGNDQPYTAYILPLESPYWGEDFTEEGTVDVVDADVTEYITLAIPEAIVTQHYLEVAYLPETTPARVTQHYLEVAYTGEPVDTAAALLNGKIQITRVLNNLDGLILIHKSAADLLDGKTIIKGASADQVDGLLRIRSSASALLDGHLQLSTTYSTSSNLDGKAIIASATVSNLDGLVVIGSASTNLFDGRVLLGNVATGPLDGLVIIRSAEEILLDGNIRIRDVSTDNLDGLLLLAGSAADLLDAQVVIKETSLLALDAKAMIRDVAQDLLDGRVVLGAGVGIYLDCKINVRDAEIGLLDGELRVMSADTAVLDGTCFISAGIWETVLDGTLTITRLSQRLASVTFRPRRPAAELDPRLPGISFRGKKPGTTFQ